MPHVQDMYTVPQRAAKKALGPKPAPRAQHLSPARQPKILPAYAHYTHIQAAQPANPHDIPLKHQPLVPALGYSNKQLHQIGMSRQQREARARQYAARRGLPMVAPIPKGPHPEAQLNRIHGAFEQSANTRDQWISPLSHTNLAFDANFAKNLVPQSLVDVAHGHRPTGKHLGEDALFFLPWSRAARASAEALNAARVADEGARAVEAGRVAKQSYKEGKGVVGGLTGASKKLLPAERAFARSEGRQQLHQTLDALFEPKVAKAQKQIYDQALRTMKRNGLAKSYDEAAGKLMAVHATPPDEVKGLYQHGVLPVPHMPESIDAKAIAKEIKATHGHVLPPELKKPGALERAINRTYEHVKLGAGYRDWYKRFAGVMARTAQSPALGHISPRQLAQLMAVYSQRAMPTENFRRAVTSALQHGDFSVFQGQAEKAKKIVEDPTWFEQHYLPSQKGPKISNYYANALEHLDPAHFAEMWGNRPAPVTIDTHMNRMLGVGDRVQDKHYEGLAQVFRAMAPHVGMSPSEVQAASWVSKKAANESENIAKKLTAKGVEFSQRPASEYLHSAGDAYERAHEKYSGTLFQHAQEIAPKGFTQHVIDTHSGQDLQGLPSKIKVAGKQVEWHSYGPAQDIASSYMEKAGLPYNPPATYAKVDPARAKRIAEWYDHAIHEPLNPEVAQAYDAMARETLAQYHEIVSHGYKFEFYPPGQDPYPQGPRQAILDLIQNKHMYVFPTEGGFGSDVPEGHIRLYRGEGTNEVGEAGRHGGQWFTTDHDMARTYGAKGRVLHVDVPHEEALKHVTGYLKHYGTGPLDPASSAEFHLPPELASRAVQSNLDHPLLAFSGETWGGQPVTHNDIFRAVHDFFGHAKEGVGFRADGEENAWRSHSAMYSPEARKAMTAETRGQNSWVNFGPHGEANRTANQLDTVYADQKAVVAPDWVVHEGAADPHGSKILNEISKYGHRPPNPVEPGEDWYAHANPHATGADKLSRDVARGIGKVTGHGKETLFQGREAGMELPGTNYEGRTGDPNHLTRREEGQVPTDALARLGGAKGEVRGAHANRQGPAWDAFVRDVKENGIHEPIFVTVDHGQAPKISEGNHRLDAAVEAGLGKVPVEIRYFGHAEHQGTVLERYGAAEGTRETKPVAGGDGAGLHQDFKEPPRSAGEVAINAAQKAGSTIRGAFEPITTPEGMKSIIHLTEHANVTTFPHELGHFLRRFGLTAAHENAVAEWAGVKNGVWDVAAEEKFAQGLEAFIRSGDAPNSLKAEFEVLAPAFHAAYPKAGDLPALTPEVKQVYRQLLGQKDGLHNAAAFLLRNKIAAHQLAIAGRRGPQRTDEGARAYLDQLAKEAADNGFGVKGGWDKPIEMKAGETSPETGGAVGALVRSGLKDPSGLKALGTYEKVGAELDNTPKTIGEMDKQQEAARGIALSNKAKSLHAAQQNALESEHPYQSFMAAGSARAGMLPKSEFKGFQTLEPHLDTLTTFVGKHPRLKPFEKQRVMEAITRGITENRMPARNERRLLAKAFGKEAASGWAKAIRRGEITLADVMNIPRAAMASMDLSAGLRQGLAAAFYKPGMFSEEWMKQLGYAFSEGRYQEAQKMIEDHPWFPLMDRGKLSLTDIHAPDLNAHEEAFGSQLAEQIPIVGKWIRGSDRAYTGFLNVLRMKLFEYMVHDAATKGWNMDDHALESIGSVVNTLTGRGNLPQGLAEHRAFLNAMFFSPGLAFSRLNMLGFGGGHGWQGLIPGSWYMGLHPYARQEALRSFTRLAAGISTVLFFAHAAGASVSIDPRNSDFGKIRVGDTRFDVAGGFQQWVRLITELGTGQIVSSTTGRVESLQGGSYAGQTRLDAALQFLENKAAPVPSMSIDLLRGTGFGNQPLSVQGELASHLVPLVWQDMYQIGFKGPPWNAHLNDAPGAGLKMAAAAAIPDILGVGVQNYGAPGPKTHQNLDKLTQQTQQAGLGQVPPQVQADVQWKSRLDAATYAGQSSFDKAKAAAQLFDERYGTSVQSILPHIHTQGQAEALYSELRSKLFPSLEKWQGAVNKVNRAKAADQAVPENAPQKSGAGAPPVVNTGQETAYRVPQAHGVDGAQHTVTHGLPPELGSAIDQAAAKYGVPASTLAGIWRIESGSTYPNPAMNKEGYGGLFGTTKAFASTQEQADYAAQTLRHLLDTHGGNMAAALSAYSGGGYTSVPGAGGGWHAGAETQFGAGPTPLTVSGVRTGGQQSNLANAADEALQMLASGSYTPMRMLSVLSSQPLQNTVEVPGYGHVKFQIPKLTGPAGKAARGAIALAEAYLGTPYVWGGESPKGFDCSGLLQYIYAKQGVNIPRTSQEQWNAGQRVAKSQLRPGDAVFFVGSDGSRNAPGHVGIYIGHGKFIEAPHTGATVRISNLAGYPGYVGARRYSRARGRRAA